MTIPEPLQEGSRRLDRGETVALRDSFNRDLHVRDLIVLLIFGGNVQEVHVDGHRVRALGSCEHGLQRLEAFLVSFKRI